jgi:membrane protein required for colicin V production
MSTTLNILDLIFIALSLIFVTVAFFRGFVKEIFSFLNWVIAFAISYFLTPILIKLLSPYWDNALAADIISRVIIFVFSFILAVMATNAACKASQEFMPQLFDRSLGVLFGIAKTLIVFGFVYSLSLNLYGFTLGKEIDGTSPLIPNWFKDAKCHNVITFSGKMLHPLVTKFFDESTKNFDKTTPKKDDLNKKIDEILGKKKFDESDLDRAIEGVEKNSNSATVDSDAGFNKKDIDKMNHLIDVIGK